VNSEELETQKNMQKEVEFYAAFVNAWITTRMEVDKQLLTLSSLAIGLLMFFYDKNKLETVTQLALWLASGFLFTITIVTILLVFRNNAKYIELLIGNTTDNKNKDVEVTLQRQTEFAFVIFILAIITTFALAIVTSGFKIIKIQGT
jgi:hypothetical protein